RTTGTVTVERVAPGSPAAEAGLLPGDQFVLINNRDVTDAFVLATELNRFQGAPVPVTILRNGEEIATEINVPRVGSSEDLTLATGFEALRLKPVYEKVPAIEVVPRGFQEA